jgi:hypothetical protein
MVDYDRPSVKVTIYGLWFREHGMSENGIVYLHDDWVGISFRHATSNLNTDLFNPI